MRLGGWHYVGIALSVLWALGAGTFVWMERVEAVNSRYTSTPSRMSDAEFNQLLCSNNHPEDWCREERQKDFAKALEGGWGNVALVALAPVPAGWGLAYLFIVARRMGIQRGLFRVWILLSAAWSVWQLVYVLIEWPAS